MCGKWKQVRNILMHTFSESEERLLEWSIFLICSKNHPDLLTNFIFKKYLFSWNFND
jgi:hypothetical protein